MSKYLLVCILFVQSFAFAQQAEIIGFGKISGSIIDSTSKEVIPYATISLFNSKNMTKPVSGALSDEKGKFEIKEVLNGSYVLKLTSIGFKEKMVKVGEINDKNLNIHLNNIVLPSLTQNLKEVTVTGQTILVEEKVDRLVYNAEKDISSKGSDATEVLRKVPLLTVDLDGNVSMRGNSNIRVLIDNKPSTIIAASVADALKQIPADQIKSVEVITSPSAKYDAEGSGGIINIITKKNNLQGYGINVDLGYGNRGSNVGLNGNLKAGKFGMTIGGFGRFANNPSATEFTQYLLNDPKMLNDITHPSTQKGDARDKMRFGRYTLGMDYDISKTKSLSAGARFGMRSFFRNQDVIQSRTILNTAGLPVLFTNYFNSNVEGPSSSWDFNLDYLHVVKSGQEFSVSTLYSRSLANSNFINTPQDENGNDIVTNNPLQNKNNNLNQEFTIQSDYTLPINKNQILEFGVKAIARVVNSEFSYLRGAAIDTTRSNGILDYKQNIGAAYMAYTYSTANKYTFKGGLRYENTWINVGYQQSTPTKQDSTFKTNYPILVPSLNVSKTYGGKYTVKMGYNKRIQRPGLQQLNPNLSMANPLSFSQGNPELLPEITHNFEASLSASIKKVYINWSLFGRQTTDAIFQVTTKAEDQEKYPGATLSKFQNVGKEVAYGTNLFGNVSITPKWIVNGGVEAFYNVISGKTTGVDGLSIDVKNQGWNLNGRMMSSVTMKDGWQVQAFAFLRGGRTQPMAAKEALACIL